MASGCGSTAGNDLARRFASIVEAVARLKRGHVSLTARRSRAVRKSLPPITGPGECGADHVVRLEAVVLPDKMRVAISPGCTN